VQFAAPVRPSIATVLCSLLVLPNLAACMVGEDEATDSTAGASVGSTERLNGCHGHASSTIPSDGRYVITTFGGPGDHQSMSCGGYADGSTWYAASRQRYGCGAKIQIEANGKCAVASTLDYGPDVCVENAAVHRSSMSRRWCRDICSASRVRVGAITCT